LITADYDVFVLVNNLPRLSITKLVKEFWLGGGGLLTFHKAFSYLNYESIIWPGLDADGYGVLWANLTCDVLNVTARHPTMKDYHINDTVSERASDWTVISEAVLDGSDVWYSMTPLLKNLTNSDFIYGLAMDSRYEGGRVVHLPGDGSSIALDFESIIVDTAQWLIPRPKGRIAFDLTHQPRISIDPWDVEFATLYSAVNNFGQFRTLAVNHTYTFDKLYPTATANLTAERMAPYDVLILVYPDLNYTAAEMIAVESWVNGGGSILILGDRTGMVGPNRGDITLNNLLQNFNMSLGTSNILGNAPMDPETHVTLENCAVITCGNRNYVNVIGSAVPIWTDGGNVVIAAQEFGSGRAILSGEMNVFDDSLLGLTNNARYSLNVLNWLTANDAEVLVFATYGDYYADVATAMRDLGQSFQLFNNEDYLDDFLASRSWNLVILDQSNQWFSTTELDAIYAYVDDGGRLIMSYHDVGGSDTHPLWSKLGFDYSANLVGTPEMFMWDVAHPIFTEPNDLNSLNFTSNIFFGDDGDTLTVLEGYTALAGSTASEQDGNALIVLSNDYQTLYNGYLIDTATGDEDDSTYRDSVELWQNEIVFMITPDNGGPPFDLDVTTLLIIGAAVAAVIIIVVLISRRRSGGSKPKKKPKKKTTKKKK
jgi:hypothetical protein